jgi:predicted oxidoreductase
MSRIIPFEQRGITSSRIAFGCMGFGKSKNSTSEEEILATERAIDAALSVGINFFDHADIYSSGHAEAVFGQVLKRRPELKDQIVIQSKTGICLPDEKFGKRYDFSKEHILSTVDGSLARLGVEHLEVLLLHRPDSLMEPEDIAEAFNVLRSSGKVRHFGVSNMSVGQIQYVQSALSVPLVANQLDMSLNRLDWLDLGVLVNRKIDKVVRFPEGTLEYCRMNNMQLQAWGPLAQGRFTGRTMNPSTETERATTELVQRMANEKETTPEAIVLGWLMRHPAMIQPVIGTINPQRIIACADAARQSELMTREEWYALYMSSRGNDIP